MYILLFPIFGDGVLEMGPVATQIALRSAERLTFWLIGLVLAFIPAMTGAHVSISPHIFDVFWRVNVAGMFRDLFFVALLLAAIGMSNLWDNIVRQSKPARPGFRTVANLAFGYYLIALLYAAFAFARLEPHYVVDSVEFSADMTALTMVIIASAATEVLIVLNE